MLYCRKREELIKFRKKLQSLRINFLILHKNVSFVSVGIYLSATTGAIIESSGYNKIKPGKNAINHNFLPACTRSHDVLMKQFVQAPIKQIEQGAAAEDRLISHKIAYISLNTMHTTKWS